MERNEALHILADERAVVAPGQTFSIGLLKPDDPADAAGVARLFYAIYGDGYPVDTAYIPERIIEESRSGRLRSRGFSLGGLLPVWFGSDGLLMQKHCVDPDFDGLKIHSECARRIVELVRRDYEKNA